MRVLVTGASSLLGKYLYRTVPDGVEWHGTWYTNWCPWTMYQMDVTDKSQVMYVFGKIKPDAVIHMASIGDVDFTEDNYRLVSAINEAGTKNVLEMADDHGARVLLTSTNAVFSGKNPPYDEERRCTPINRYGTIRRRAEQLVGEYGGFWQIARLFLLYGWEPSGARGNWGSTAVRKLKDGKTMCVVDDVFYQPTYAKDAAEALWALLLNGGAGIWHVAGHRRVSLFEFVSDVAEVFGYDQGLVERASINEFPGLAPRPIDSTYVLEKAKRAGIVCAGPRNGLERMRNEVGSGM